MLKVINNLVLKENTQKFSEDNSRSQRVGKYDPPKKTRDIIGKFTTIRIGPECMAIKKILK